ncbi:MAG: hypothetical protein EGP07_05540 [SAR202 cluster bacterium]|nr:MAG: hypothetical protein EGP11_02570 [SAR202 cluster bacterium]MBF06225.1 hypothetical protein [Chloroflexota bacterium]MCH2530024.1 hypothetical protein [Dehalococcoidia bacterium]KAA1300395.1 MAG: hypothetical protein EGP07_05540 [SAR202 cluster bacterium]KAA1304811.1 MAG: hypothetical protein EGP04_02295 [SAR202 cluster bacterium]
MKILDMIAPRRGPKRRRRLRLMMTAQLTAKTAFYVSVVAGAIFVLAAFILFDKDRELEQIPSTRTGPQVIRQVEQYLKNTNVYAYGDRSRTLNCWAEFEGQEFKAEYLNRGSWRIDAYYDLVRYYWRVDDITLEVTRDPWVKTYNPSIGC